MDYFKEYKEFEERINTKPHTHTVDAYDTMCAGFIYKSWQLLAPFLYFLADSIYHDKKDEMNDRVEKIRNRMWNEDRK